MKVNLEKGNCNRLWLVLGILASKNGEATLSELSSLSGFPRSSTENLLKKIIDGQIPQLILVRQQATFTVKQWGDFLPKKTLINHYQKIKNSIVITK